MKPTTPDTEVSPPVQADKLVKNISAVDADGNGLRFRYVECMFPFQTQTDYVLDKLLGLKRTCSVKQTLSFSSSHLWEKVHGVGRGAEPD